MSERKKPGRKPGTGPNLVGKTFNSWLVLAPAPNLACSASLRWRCRCKCGHEQDCFGSDLTRGYTKQCATCAAAERAAKRPPSNRKAWPSEYVAWVNMKSRCYDKKQASYPNYGGRGITVCERWKGKGGFERFLEDVGPKPGKLYSIDRINSDASYSPGNCRWSTRTAQNRNRRNNVGTDGESLSAMCEKHDMPYRTVLHRVRGLGWTVEEALERPIREKRSEPWKYRDTAVSCEQYARAKRAGVFAEYVHYREVVARDGEKCRDCGTTHRLEMHHVMPLSKGGPHILANISLLCRHCNATRKDHGG